MPPLQSAIFHLGLSETQGIALIDNLFLEGTFEPQQLWNSIHLIGGNFGKDSNTLADKIFSHVCNVMHKAGAYNNRNTFKPEYVFKHLFSNESLADIQDAEDLLVYWSQSSYGRKANQERYELPEQKNLRVNQKRYLENATALGIVGSMYSDRHSYNETWILGAPHQAMFDRLETAQASISSGVSPGEIKILAGAWEMCLEVSGLYNPLSGKLEGGAIYLIELANKNGIPIDKDRPFIVHQSSPNDRSGRTPGRTYINLAPHESRKLTEAMMAQDLVQQILSDRYRNTISVTETSSDADQRPDTLMQVQQEAKRLVACIKLRGGAKSTDKQKEYHIQLVSGQPSVTRQALLTQRTINEILQQEGIQDVSVTVHGIGADANVRIETLQSEAAAFIHQLYLTATEHQSRKRSAECLMFRTRPDDLENIPPLPASSTEKSRITHTINPQKTNQTISRF